MVERCVSLPRRNLSAGHCSPGPKTNQGGGNGAKMPIACIRALFRDSIYPRPRPGQARAARAGSCSCKGHGCPGQGRGYMGAQLAVAPLGSLNYDDIVSFKGTTMIISE